MKIIKLFPYKLLLLLFFYVGSIYAQSSNDIEWTDCFLDDCSGLDEYPNVKFGYLTVPENYELPNRRPLKIAFAVIKSTDENAKPDPVLSFTGGWGATILSRVPFYAQNTRIKDRDLILFDYRGSGYSEPKLCDWIGEEAWEDIKANLTNEIFGENQTERFNKCLDSLEIRGIDFNQYGSNTKTRDAVKLAEALGYESYNLKGTSYGTRAILNFIRNAEKSDVKIRSVIMDSNSPIGLVLQGTKIDYYIKSLNSILKDCEQNPDCNKNFPNLKARFIEYLQTLDNEPWIIPFEDGSTFSVNKEELNAYVHQLLYDPLIYPYMPLILEHFIARDDNVFKTMVIQIEERAKSNYNALGLVNFVYDHKYFKDSAQIKYDQLHSKNPHYKLMDAYIDFYFSNNRIGTDSLEHIPVKSDIPALFLAGTYDPITPPSLTKFTASGFSNHFLFEFPRYGHGILNSACGWNLTSQFISNPNIKPDNACLEKIGENAIPFKTAYYKNSSISVLLTKLNERDVSLIALLLFVALVSIVNLVLFVKNLIKKPVHNRPNFNLTSLLIILFGVGLTIMISRTMSNGPFLLLFGLIEQANYIFYLTALILMVGLIQVFQWIRNSKKTKWSYVSILSLIVFVAVVINYNLFPNV